MSPPPDDFFALWSLAEIGTLDHHAFVTGAPSPASQSFTVCFWFQNPSAGGTKVIVNHGNKDNNQSGWTVFLEGETLCFRAAFDDLTVATTTIPVPTTAAWRHFTGVVDRQQNKLIGYLNGSNAGWRDGESATILADSPITPDDDLIIGGYTDSAGGHFDHTFGRKNTGWVDDCRIYRRALSSMEIAAFVHPDNRPPVATFQTRPISADAPVTVRFDARESVDSDGTIESYLWDFGDGSTGMGLVVEHHYPYRGSYCVRLTVIDNDHGQSACERTLHFAGRANPLKITPVFVNGTEGYACYRIPSIVRAQNGDLLAFAEGRVANCSDSSRPIRIVCKRSQDNGRTWSPLQVVGQNIVGGDEYMAQNCSPVVDVVHGTGRIIVLFNKLEHSEWDISSGIGLSRICCIQSNDNGLTWYHERDITDQVHRPYQPDYEGVYPHATHPANREADWRVQRPTLGHAIQLTHSAVKGRLFFAGTMTRGDRSVFQSQNYAFWSDDMGESWTIGGINSQVGLNEAIAVELESGDVMINSRGYHNERSLGKRAVTIAVFDDTGAITFGETIQDHALTDPAVQASMIRYTHNAQTHFGGKSRILFSNPNHTHARMNMTVRLSYDEGKTWAFSKTVDPGPAAYSDLVIQGDGKIGLLYERGNQGGIVYVNFTLDWLTDGQDSL